MTASCSYQCDIWADAFTYLWYPTVLTRIVATEIVVISTSDGQPRTTTSSLQVNTTIPSHYPIPTDDSVGGFGGGYSYINDTVFVTPIDTPPVAQIDETYLTTTDGKVICTTDNRHPSPSDFVISTTTEFLPPSLFSNWGVLTPSLCSQIFFGIPTENLPVLSLTETRTVTAQGLQGYYPSDSAGQLPASTQASPTTLSTGIFPTVDLPQPAFTPTPPPLASTLNPKPLDTGKSGTGEADNNAVPQSAHPAEVPSVDDTKGGSVEVTNNQNPAGEPTGSNDNQRGSNEAPPSPFGTENAPSKDTPIPDVINPSPNAQNPNVPESTGAAVVPQTLNLPSSTIAPLLLPLSLPLITVGGQKLTSNLASQYIIGALTLTPGRPAITIGGTPISLQVSTPALVIGSSIVPLPALPTPNNNIVTLGGFDFTQGPDLGLLIGTQTITPGAPAVFISGTPVSLAAAGTALAVGSVTSSIHIPPGKDDVVLDGFTFTRDQDSNLVIGGQTITPGAPAVLVSGTPVSLAAAGTALAVGSTTASIPIPSSNDVVAIDGFTFTRDQNSHLIIGSQTISPGAPAVTISGTPISLPISGPVVVIASSTFPIIPTPPATTTRSGKPVILDIDGVNSLTELSGSDFVIGSQTLLPGGPAITINGTEVVSLPPGATDVVIGSQTAALVTSQALGDVILSAFFPAPPAPAPPAATPGNG
ncbi:MAG: hypothetical protein LQ352_005381, partial [Teloschistes flavicans]